MSRTFLHTLFGVFLLIFIGSCSTEKNTRLSRTYHNVTSKYNIYFNGKESLNTGVERINQSVEDDFTRLLPIFKSSDPGTDRVARSDMEYAIMKASKLIKVHSITKKPKRRGNRSQAYIEMASKEEYNRWVDDSYILMGKAYFYMKNYMAAIENLSYVVRKFSEEDTKFEAYIWLIRSYTELGRYNDALELIQSVDASVDFPKKYDEEFALAVADFHVRQNAFDEAIPHLRVAIHETFWRKNKVRLKYILAQLYQETDQHDLATETFREVAKMNPPYEMAFNARINAAGSFSGEGDVDKLKKELRKMLRDSKNYDFRDQIYFALGNIATTEGNKKAAIDYYIQSASASSVNVFQRALSCLTLADIYFEEKHYMDAQSYYDSAMVVIDETYPKYESIAERYNSLTRLTDNLYTVVREDSLQQIAALSEPERNALVTRWINEARAEEQRLRQLASAEMSDRNFFRMNQSRMGLTRNQQGSGWYFYNPTTVAYGKVEFQQIWGERKLEDDWRRGNKNSASLFEMEELEQIEAGIDSSEIRVGDPMAREYYLQDVPLTEEGMAESHQQIRDALFSAGRIFKQEFENYERSIQQYEELLKRYDPNPYQLSSYFELWDLYQKVGNQMRSEYYKNLIVANYPDSKYAKFLVNPDFFIELEARKDSVNNLYQQAFYNYQQGNYQTASEFVQQIRKLEPDTLLLPKISFIETIAEGVRTDFDRFGRMLNEHIQTYAESGTVPLARQVLKLIEDSTLADYQKLVEIGYLNDQIQNEELLPENQAANDEFGGKFSYDDELLHYFVIAFPRDAKVDLNRLKFDIANYNIDHYTRMDFDIETENLNPEIQLVVVRSLPDKQQSLIYFRSMIRQREVFQSLGDLQYVNFVASSYNYREILSDNSYLEYLSYFVKNYSRFITNDFPADALDDPEELMARIRAEEEQLEERGSFVVVKADETQGLFARETEVPQNFVIAVNDPKFDIRALVPAFTSYNRSQFANLNLTIEQQKFGDYQLMVVKSMSDIREAMNYFSKVVANRMLYQSLETRTYRNFIITDANLKKMLAESSIDDYVAFFRDYYISGDFAKSNVPASQSAPASSANETVLQTPAEPAKPAYDGPFNPDVEGKQFFILMIPKAGVDGAALKAAIETHNQQKSPGANLFVEALEFDAENLILKVSGIDDKESGMNYLRGVVQNQQVYQPLMELNYRNFVISPANFDILMRTKSIGEYLELYKASYLNRQ